MDYTAFLNWFINTCDWWRARYGHLWVISLMDTFWVTYNSSLFTLNCWAILQGMSPRILTIICGEVFIIYPDHRNYIIWKNLRFKKNWKKTDVHFWKNIWNIYWKYNEEKKRGVSGVCEYVLMGFETLSWRCFMMFDWEPYKNKTCPFKQMIVFPFTQFSGKTTITTFVPIN